MKRLPQLLFLVLPLVLVLTATAAELPKELRTAEVMIQDGLGRDAIPRLRTYLTKNNSTPQSYAQLLLAEALLSDHRPDEALTALPKTPPTELDIRCRLVRASSLSELGRWKEAATNWKELKSKDLTPALTSQIKLGLATAYLNQNERSLGIKELREILKEPGQDSARLLLVKALLAEGQPDEAEKELSAFPENTPAPVQAEARYWNAEILTTRGKPNEALELLRKVISDGAGVTRDVLAQAWMAIGRIDRARDKPADATTDFEKALDQGGEPETYLTAVREYLSSSQASQALPTATLHLRDSIREREGDDEKRGRFAPGLLLLAATTLDAGNAEAAAADLDTLIKTYPASPAVPGAQLLLAEALLKQGQQPAAREQIRSLLSRENLSPQIIYQGRAALADLLTQEGKHSEASSLWEQAAQTAPDSASAENALFNAALSAARQPDPPSFLRLEEVFTKRYPESSRRAALALERGRMLESKGDSAASRSALAEVAKLPGADSLQPEATLRRASSLLRTGDYPAAVIAFAEFEKQFPNSPLLPQAMASGIEARLRSRELTGAQARTEFAKILARSRSRFSDCPNPL